MLPASEQDAITLSNIVRQRHMPYGTILDPVFATPSSGQIVLYSRCGDSAIWTGHYLAGEAFRYTVTRSPQALDNVRAALNGLQSLVDVTGNGLLARCVTPVHSPYAPGITQEEAQHGVYFFIFWLPKYLGDVRHLDIRRIGYYAWVPFAFAGAGSFIGGWFSSVLVRRNLTIDRSRKIALGISAALMPVSLLIAASPLSLAIAFFSLAMFGHQSWSTIVQTLPADMFPSTNVGSVAGLLGAVGSTT